MINKILVAIDGSEHSYKALTYALDIAEKFKAPITLLNVFQPVIVQSFLLQPALPETISINRDLIKFHQDLLAKTLENAKKAKPNISITAELRQGDAAEQILDAANSGGYDTIVFGHRGESRIEGFLMGSVSDKVSKHAQTTVIIVK